MGSMTLAAFMALRAFDDLDMALLIGDCQESAIRKWRTGARMPRPKNLRRIMEVTEGAVTPSDFVLQTGVAA